MDSLIKKDRSTLIGSVIETLNVIELCEEKLEQGEEIPQELMILDHSLSNLQQNVDKRISLLERLDLEVKGIDEQMAFFQGKKKILLEVKDKIKEHTKSIVEQFPDVEFKGTAKKLVIQKNGGKQAIDWKIELNTLPFVLRERDVQYCPEAYVSERTVKVLNVPSFEEDLRNGKISQADIADLKERGTHLRVR